MKHLVILLFATFFVKTSHCQIRTGIDVLEQNGFKELTGKRIGDYDTCACIGTHAGRTSEIGSFRIISHDFNDGKWRVRFKLG